MRILLCYPRFDIIGGAPRTVLTLAKGLRERGHGVFLLAKNGGILEHELAELGIHVIPAPFDPLCPGVDLLNVRAYRKLIWAIDHYSIDVIHSLHYHSYFLALFAAVERNIPVVFTAVWFLGPRRFPAYPGRITFVAAEFRDQAKPLLGDYPRELAVLPICIDLDRFRCGIGHAEFAKEYGLPESCWKIAFVSRIDTLKLGSLSYAIEAARVLSLRGREFTLAIAGDGPLFDEVSEHATRVNRELARDAVRLLGPILDTPPFMSWADIVLGIGSCALEGMACGKPTLIVGERGIAGVVGPETIEKLAHHNFAGRNLEAPVSPSLLADAIEQIMLDPQRYSDLSKFVSSYARESLDCRGIAERFERVYENALGDPPLTLRERARLLLTSLYFGYALRLYDAWIFRIRKFLGRTR